MNVGLTHNVLQRAERVLQEVNVDDVVWAKHKNGRYYKAKVTQAKEQMFVEVDFADGSFSTDTFPEDIEVAIVVAP